MIFKMLFLAITPSRTYLTIKATPRISIHHRHHKIPIVSKLRPSDANLVESSQQRRRVTSVLGTLALTGGTTGTFLDGIHSKVGVIKYDIMPIDIGSGLHTSILVPPLLAAFYVSIGAIILYADYKINDPVTIASYDNVNLLQTAASFGVLAAMLELSSFLYSQDISSSTICLALALCASINYLVFDSTKQGLALAVLCAVAAPAIELLLMQYIGLWHYPQGDLYNSIGGGIPRWVPFCYFFYPPAVIQFTRYLWKFF